MLSINTEQPDSVAAIGAPIRHTFCSRLELVRHPADIQRLSIRLWRCFVSVGAPSRHEQSCQMRVCVHGGHSSRASEATLEPENCPSIISCWRLVSGTAFPVDSGFGDTHRCRQLRTKRREEDRIFDSSCRHTLLRKRLAEQSPSDGLILASRTIQSFCP
jgi:hypothetical protein